VSEHSVHLIGGAVDERAEIVATSTAPNECHIAISYRGKRLDASGIDYFAAFQEIRLQLEAEGLIPFCYGASLNVWPSGMCRSMGNGMVGYRLKMGTSTTREDIVRIFDAGADIVPASVSQQRQFFEEWGKSFAV
jgi:hypothetical protein